VTGIWTRYRIGAVGTVPCACPIRPCGRWGLLKMIRRIWINATSWLRLIWLYLVVTGHFFVWRVHIWFHSSYSRESTQLRMKQTLLLIRHGETTWNREHRLPGQLPGVALTEEGRRQAASLAEALSEFPISTVVSSPLERARETAKYLTSARNLQLQFEPDLMDTNVGHWSGQIFEDLLKSDPAWKAYLQDPTVAPAGIETFPQVQQRVVAAVEHWRTCENVGSYLAFVAHADVIKLLLAHYMRLDVKRAANLAIDNASVSVVQIGKEERLHVVAIGWTPRPGWLKPPLINEEHRGNDPSPTQKETRRDSGSPLSANNCPE
jgi:broad specificity phosphatase PhoE